MGIPLFTNNAATGIVYPISAVDVTIYLNGGTGSLFPNPTGGDYFYATLLNQVSGDTEIVKCVARSGDIVTVERAQEGTTPLSFPVGTGFQLRITAASLNTFANPVLQTIEGTADQVDVNTVGTTTTISLTNPINVDTTGNATTADSATSATNATNAANLITTNFTITESGGKLVFKYGTTIVASLDSTGNLITKENITAYGTP